MVGSSGIVHPAAPVGGSYAAKADVVDPVIDAASGTFGVRLILANPNRTIPAGIRCSVEWHDEKTVSQ
jgi:membrane fusion protein, multidrug efflux system